MDEIAHLNRAMSPGHDAHSSLGTSSTAVFSTHDESTVTKPTSTGTVYPHHIYKGKGKAKAPYASSLSVAHGSGSEADAQHQTTRRDDLLAMGDWAASDLNPAGILKGSARAKKRCQHGRCTASKKPSVKIVQPKDPVKVLPYEDHDAIITVARSDEGPGKVYHYGLFCFTHSLYTRAKVPSQACHPAQRRSDSSR
ncbi:hypothetical protein BKA66DRAFT_462693 [Pyrenochaeta sp. MPI-SDFR-AT-0127]|nr:hypothetical protein BKA66DRAFT_462693 [Pyrenochaeta sp. MPI-SDFR-AT-0127]